MLSEEDNVVISEIAREAVLNAKDVEKTIEMGKEETIEVKSELEKLKGKRIKNYDIWTNVDSDKVKGFDLIFEDDSRLEVYGMTCDKLDEECKEKEITLIELFTDKKVKTKGNCVLGGGMGFVFATKEENE